MKPRATDYLGAMDAPPAPSMGKGRVVKVYRARPTDTRPIPYATQAFPGEPIYLRFGTDEPLLISDSAALFLAHQLVQFVMGNLQSKARANGN